MANGFVIKFASGKYLQDIDSDLEGGYPVVLTHEFENAVVIPREKLAKTIAGLISGMSPVLTPFEEEHRVAGIEHLRILIRHGDMTQRDVVAARREPISEAEAWDTINAWIASGEVSVDSRNRLHF